MSAVEHFDLSGRAAVVIGNVQPVIEAITDAFVEAGADVEAIRCRADESGQALGAALARRSGISIVASAFDLFLAKPLADVTHGDLDDVLMANFSSQLFVCQRAVTAMRSHGTGGRIVLVTHVLGERGLPNTSIYAGAHGAVHNLVRALAQEVAPEGISVNAIALGWMDWMTDRLDPQDEHAARAVRFTIAKRAGSAEDLGPLAVWLSGSGAGFVTGQIFPLDGGLTQHL